MAYRNLIDRQGAFNVYEKPKKKEPLKKQEQKPKKENPNSFLNIIKDYKKISQEINCQLLNVEKNDEFYFNGNELVKKNINYSISQFWLIKNIWVKNIFS